ncbi:Planctomycete cytochrome C [Maioricimonas rarisocia]|uniref:Planctomycete cytochrome C n=1 Tax=Maioricimonas rarisocia TaxID=2528026 RepID=A0A517ZF74_9PLAN|nr:DUF1553 domain-containing protein [Maioricimonas rarisocia]QDU41114.1 Planctomycete cytochrome C [Maioricimonas rarisocia]
MTLSASAWSAAAAEVDFNRDVRPILSGRCYSCHGPDAEAREADLRLDVREEAVRELYSDVHGIVPGDPDASAVIERVTSDDPDLRMPPASQGPPLTPGEIDILRRWIASGAEYDRHWSFVPPRRPALPEVASSDECRNGIDHFVRARLAKEGFEAAPEADRYTLIRRVSLDLTGLPPTIDEVDAFVNDESPDAYEKLVDRLLKSPQFGEKWARMWLDLARYADSAGYADDPPRTIWMYRDWVIGALNSNLPFDQFTIEQLAGDLLPDPTEDQLIATAFHRNTMTNSEGGTDDEEFRNVAIVDRVNTTLQVWMGVTMGCAQCHTHKYDPITQEEYYRVFDIFNQTEDADRRDEAPTLAILTEDQQQKKTQLESQRATAQQQLEAALQQARESGTLAEPSEGPLLSRFVRIELPGKDRMLSLAEVQVFADGHNVATGGKATQSSVGYDGPAKLAIDGNTDGHYFNAKSTTHTEKQTDPWWEVDLGQAVAVEKVAIWNRSDSPGIGARLNGFRIVLLDAQRKPLWVQTVETAPQKDGSYEVPAAGADLTKEQRQELARYQEINSPEIEKLRKEVARLDQQIAGIKPITTPVLRELPEEKRRTTRIQIRGNFLDLGPEVAAGIPSAFHPIEAASPNRLDFAKWLVDEANPLTARVTVNRLWGQLFGRGLVVTTEDFGLQGELPSHPELLDWLAVEFMESGWDVKHILKTMVLSATYRQSSDASPEQLERDPDNVLLARGPRFRLSAEAVRDQALFAGGLLSLKMYGPSVYPPRPTLGLRAAFGGSTDWETSKGENRYRRGLYTFWRRSLPYPSMDAFDAPSREVCTLRRIRTNTPLQALVTLNDPVYVEAAQGLARRVLADGGSDDRQRATYAFRLCVSRPPTESELAVLVESVHQARERLAQQPDEAAKLASEPLGPLPDGVDPVEAAAWTVMGNVLLNLDEALARR